MTRRLFAGLIAILFLNLLVSAQSGPLDLTTRTIYQRAIEEVYWQHRIWPGQNPTAKPPLDAIISPQQLQEKSEDALRLSNALEKYWHQAITGQQLQAEILRLAQNTKQPDVLRQLFAALDHRPQVIAEVLARPLLTERMARSFYEQDQRFSSKRQTFDSWWAKTRSKFPAQVTEPQFSYVMPKISDTPGKRGAWTPTHDLPDADSGMTAVWTGAEMIVWGGGPNLAPVYTGSRYNPATDTWHSTNNSSVLFGKTGHTAVWTGTQMIIWGGCELLRDQHACDSATGQRYNPVTDSWVATSNTGVPLSRMNHTAVWTGTEMIVYGGCSFINDACLPSRVGTSGGRYKPSTDTWTQTSDTNAPSAREAHTAAWTGKRMIIWGGFDDFDPLNTGAVYNPASDTWTATASRGAPASRYFQTTVWTGKEMILWGGSDGRMVFCDGFRYDPNINQWHPISLRGAPTARAFHAAVWTGTEMIIWGGSDGFTYPNTGGRYDPVTNSWKPTKTLNAPPGRSGRSVFVWTGKLMIVWGGFARTGGRYDPAANSWTPTNANETASGRERHTAVWTGTEMIVWGGDDSTSGLGINTGGRYTLATDSWAPTSTVGVPESRESHTAVWTGTEMIVWGGQYGNYGFKTGGRYNPVTDSWTHTKKKGAPEARASHAAVWTGTEMIVFGGAGMNFPWINTGGRYNPSTDSWTATPTKGAPTPRELAAAVWSGSEMIVWGGATENFDTNTGGRYNPSANTWTRTSVTGAPSARDWTSAAWTGSKMLIWGGQTYDGGYTYHNDGGLYDPATDKWTPTSLTHAPTPRGWFGYVWTGADLIAWGGCGVKGGFCSGSVFTGGRYNLATDSWTPTSTSSAPAARDMVSAVWTGSQMIVWGGHDWTGFFLPNTGGVYTPAP
jgi:N-acetylneuraminic acid mutarotase